MQKVEKMMINMYDLLICLTNAGDLINHEIADHHQQVAYMAFRIAEQMQLPVVQKKDLTLAGLLHDVGAFSLDERMALIENEPPSAQDHAVRGARLLEEFGPLTQAADYIRYHHVPWKDGAGRTFNGQPVTHFSHILHLADRIAVSIDRSQNVIGQIKAIQQKILSLKGTVFMPELVDAFMEISGNEYIWLDMEYRTLLYTLPDIVVFDTVELDLNEIIKLTEIFANIIDFRNPFTANHSAGVAKTAEKLAELAGFSKSECQMMLIAGNLHDLGKLAVSKDILDKPDSLNKEEFNVIRSHTFYTFRLLQAIKGFETINTWASFHHERLNGKGYPFHLGGDALSLGSRIMAVADIFTAIMEDRPYRAGMSDEKASGVLRSMADEQVICPFVLSILMDNFTQINDLRKQAQETSRIKYNYIMKT